MPIPISYEFAPDGAGNFTAAAFLRGTDTEIYVTFYEDFAGQGGFSIGKDYPEGLYFFGPVNAPYFPAGREYGIPGEFLVFVTAPVTTPELSTWAMMLLGFAGLGYAGYRRSRKAVSIAA
jgi:hypothetical protein